MKFIKTFKYISESMKYLDNYKVFEIHYKDRLPKGFEEFRKKWNKHKKGDEYYVQFSNNKGDYINKSSFSSPDHSDPKGNYGYPLRYVIDHPMDLWYGVNAKYLRVLKSKSRNTLYLNSIKTKEDCVWTLKNCYNNKDVYFSEGDVEDIMKKSLLKHKARLNGGNKWAKVFFQCIQVDYTESVSQEPILRSAKEQSDLLLNGGYDAIIDQSRSINTAVINDREPNQIVFIRPVFDVVDIFTLTDKDEVNKQMTTMAHQETMSRKWTSLILNELDGDKIKETGKSNLNGISYYSVKGRELIIDFLQRDTSYRNDIKIGQKRHKAHKLNDDYTAKITIKTEYGRITDRVYEDGRLKDTLYSIKTSWEDIKRDGIQKDWEERTLKGKSKAEDKAKDIYYKKKKEEDREKAINMIPKFTKSIEYWSEKNNIDFKIPQSEETLIKYVNSFDSLTNILRARTDKLGYIDKQIIEFKEDVGSDDAWLMKFYYGDDNLENVINYLNIMKGVLSIDSYGTLYMNFYNI